MAITWSTHDSFTLPTLKIPRTPNQVTNSVLISNNSLFTFQLLLPALHILRHPKGSWPHPFCTTLSMTKYTISTLHSWFANYFNAKQLPATLLYPTTWHSTHVYIMTDLKTIHPLVQHIHILLFCSPPPCKIKYSLYFITNVFQAKENGQNSEDATLDDGFWIGTRRVISCITFLPIWNYLWKITL